jgi:hypothetical protein
MSSLRRTFIQYGPIRSAGRVNIYCSSVSGPAPGLGSGPDEMGVAVRIFSCSSNNNHTGDPLLDHRTKKVPCSGRSVEW